MLLPAPCCCLQLAGRLPAPPQEVTAGPAALLSGRGEEGGESPTFQPEALLQTHWDRLAGKLDLPPLLFVSIRLINIKQGCSDDENQCLIKRLSGTLLVHYCIELENLRNHVLMVISIKILFIGASVAVTATSVGSFGVIFSKFLRTIVNSYSAYACGALTHCLLMNLQNHAPCCLVLQEYLASLTAFCGEIL